MARSVALARCRDCERFQAAYEHATAVRMQAEADLLAAVHSHDSAAIQAAARTLRTSLVDWGHAHHRLRQHEKNHGLATAPSRRNSAHSLLCRAPQEGRVELRW